MIVVLILVVLITTVTMARFELARRRQQARRFIAQQYAYLAQVAGSSPSLAVVVHSPARHPASPQAIPTDQA